MRIPAIRMSVCCFQAPSTAVPPTKTTTMDPVGAMVHSFAIAPTARGAPLSSGVQGVLRLLLRRGQAVDVETPTLALFARGRFAVPYISDDLLLHMLPASVRLAHLCAESGTYASRRSHPHACIRQAAGPVCLQHSFVLLPFTFRIALHTWRPS